MSKVGGCIKKMMQLIVTALIYRERKKKHGHKKERKQKKGERQRVGRSKKEREWTDKG